MCLPVGDTSSANSSPPKVVPRITTSEPTIACFPLAVNHVAKYTMHPSLRRGLIAIILSFMQIDLEPHQHSTLIEVVKTPKQLFFAFLALWLALGAGLVFVLGLPWLVICYGVMGVAVGIGWASAFPEYHMRRLKD